MAASARPSGGYVIDRPITDAASAALRDAQERARRRARMAFILASVFGTLAIAGMVIGTAGRAWGQEEAVLAQSAQRGLTVLVDGAVGSSGWCAEEVDLLARLADGSVLAEDGALEAFLPRVMPLLVQDCPALERVRVRVEGGVVTELEAERGEGWAMRALTAPVDLNVALDAEPTGDGDAGAAPSVPVTEAPGAAAASVGAASADAGAVATAMEPTPARARQQPAGPVIDSFANLPDRVVVAFGEPVVERPFTYDYVETIDADLPKPFDYQAAVQRVVPGSITIEPDYRSCVFSNDPGNRFCQIRLAISATLSSDGIVAVPPETKLQFVTVQIERRDTGLLVATERGRSEFASPSGLGRSAMSVFGFGLTFRRDPEGILRPSADGDWAGSIVGADDAFLRVGVGLDVEYRIKVIRSRFPSREPRMTAHLPRASSWIKIPLTFHIGEPQ